MNHSYPLSNIFILTHLHVHRPDLAVRGLCRYSIHRYFHEAQSHRSYREQRRGGHMASQGELLGIYHRDVPSVSQNKLKGLTLSQQQDDLRKEKHMGAQFLKQSGSLSMFIVRRQASIISSGASCRTLRENVLGISDDVQVRSFSAI